ncbi:MAG TPA: DUF433 domain-containing protein [Frankiaceae bacterium]|jgi:uncharacterized protein (DUF433 family)/transposase-like protein|nr:DUF433 domain-containing protein [Frankiaceae bacterium]
MADDRRFDVPLYTVGEAAAHLGVPPATFSRWARGYRDERPTGRATVSPPVVTAFDGRGATVPFVGLAEGLVLAAFRRAGVPLQRIRPALTALQKELGVEHALASRRLYTDGAELLYDYADRSRDDDVREHVMDLVVVRSNQRVFTDVVRAYLRRVTYDRDGWAGRIALPAYRVADVVADPRRNFGQPYFVRGGVRVEDVLDRWFAGESMDDLAADYGVPLADIEDAVRVSKRRAAA